jgi:uncharacterized OsmC-like protein
MNPTTIQETIRLWQAEPGKAKGKPAVKSRSDGAQAVLEFGAFAWRADLPAPLGGTGEAPTPTALLLSALASCAVLFIRDMLAPQLGVNVEGVSATAQCEADNRGLFGLDGAAPDLYNFQLAIQIESRDSEAKVRELFRIWQERCPIYLALAKPQSVNVTLDIKGE